MNKNISIKYLYIVLAAVLWPIFILLAIYAVAMYVGAQPTGDPTDVNGLQIFFAIPALFLTAGVAGVAILFTVLAVTQHKKDTKAALAKKASR